MAHARSTGPGAEEDEAAVLPADGPLGARLRLRAGKPKGGRPGVLLYERDREPAGDANALVVLRRLSFSSALDAQGRQRAVQVHAPLHRWAAGSGAGQKNTALLQGVLERRQALVERWTGASRAHRRLRLSPEWRLVTGLGLQYGVLDSGMALHGTYGWPVIPASSLKGLAAAGARLSGADAALVRRLLGDPRLPEERPAGPAGEERPPERERSEAPPDRAPSAESSEGSRPGDGRKGRGGVVFLDALPDGRPVEVHGDVITPHQQPYYTDTMPRPGGGAPEDPRPPAEHHNPVPVPFLSVSGDLRVDLLGSDPDDLDTVADWLKAAGDEIGTGGRTTAGYGYFTCTEADTAPTWKSTGGKKGKAGGGGKGKTDEKKRRRR
ncbi:type III-B CRISPR module RAMP protein Cmr6 [Nocardiopsis potens]|uniref:type III-B CRISPR module RAMP protein Cmr6 n=1 Tax=Nocardiopsis potens TaxID=1246458 RepID=UPI0003454B05|nr:type III-B CRISPR module RAMP protein Cmr6 [Nocardiopsis potens]